ncbi:MAG TPA: HAD family phosphatase [Desulfomonilia bacterium]
MIKAIFWDNDGVLVDTEEIYFQANRDTLAGAGIELTRQDFLELSLIRGKGVWGLAEMNGMSHDEIERLKEKRNRIYNKELESGIPLINGVKEVLEILDGKYIMGIVTSAYRHDFEIIHRSTGILQYFNFVLAGGEYEYYKPHPAPYLRAIELSGCKPWECMAIEDSPRGVESAVKAGIRCIAVPHGITEGLDFPGAWKIMSHISQVPQALSLA